MGRGSSGGNRLSTRNKKVISQYEALQKENEARGRQESSYQAKKGTQYSLNKFKLEGKHKEIAESMYNSEATVIQGVSGVGKTTVAVQTALKMLGENNQYNKIIFIKNPTESGDDKIGYLKGDENEKLEAHFESMRTVFLEFMSAGALESAEKNGNIEFLIPNFVQGRTLKNAIIIVDETQNMSPSTVKLVLERTGDDTKLVVLGDKAQTYAVDKRKDGFTDFVFKITHIVDVEDENGKVVQKRESKEELFHYIELDSSMNKRSPLSKRVTELYA